jgi:predicted regulator of Ras-like GTPase activity (Roadblock/LC7/MglB family)
MSLSYSLNFTAGQIEAIEDNLDTLYWDAEAKCVLLADNSGQFISKKGEVSEHEMAILSALAAAQLSATQEIARLVSEPSRFTLLQEGSQQSVYILNIEDELILAVVFSSHAPLGMVRMVVRQVINQISNIAKEAKTSTHSDFHDDEFTKLLVDQLDDMLFE